MNLLKNLLAAGALAAASFAFVGCSKDKKDEKCTLTCPTGQTLNETTCKCEVKDVADEVVVLSGAIKKDTKWTADKIYELAGKVVVESGATLTIEPGTIVKGRSDAGSLASALVIARGGKIMAEGTADKPIIFTSVNDNIKVGEKMGTSLNQNDNKQWGGLILLGKAPISAEDGDTVASIEGIPADEEYGKYGGSVAADNSGSLKYISIRHGGQLIGDGNEINGLTLGGVGSGTTIENVEVVANFDDGVEFFGGTVNVKNVIVSYQGDDAIDIDQNYSGTVDNVYIIHGGSDTDEAFEIDGPENKTYKNGKFTVKNATAYAVDQTATSAGDFKSKAQGTVDNVVFKGYKKGIKVRANFETNGTCGVKTDAYNNVLSGSLMFKNVELVASEISKASVYVKDKEGETAKQECLSKTTYSEKLVAKLTGISVVEAATKTGADVSKFDWTWTKAKGLIK